MMMVKRFIFLLVALTMWIPLLGQVAAISGEVTSGVNKIPFAKVMLSGHNYMTTSNEQGQFVLENIPAGNYKLMVMATGFEPFSKQMTLEAGERKTIAIELEEQTVDLDEVVVSGTMKEVSKLESPVPIEVYSAKFFKSNPTPSLFEAVQNINGVRPQVNCNICSTGDIHINGMEGPYTMILIDGMPIVSGLSTVYGLSGIPQSLIDRIEVVKGPASTLYGSEAVGGLLNVITKTPEKTALISADAMGTSYGEVNADLAGKIKVGQKASTMLGVNYFNYSFPVDHNNDGFTDVTLQNRFSVFNKWNFKRKNNRLFSMAGRYVYENRWGGDMNWNESFRGGDSIYGESIYTKRWEFFGTYQLQTKEHLTFQWSANGHDQNSVYGKVSFLAQQYIAFGQFLWRKEIKRHDLLAAAVFRYTYYDDNTAATANPDTLALHQNAPSITYLPGLFVQDEISLNENHKLLLGLRFDYNSIYGNILTPRVNYKWSSNNKRNVVRIGFGNGYRVANIFTEDHAALTGAREVIFANELKPEKSWNGTINFVKKIPTQAKVFVGLDASLFYTYFTNKIIANYDLDPNKIIYDNIDGYATSRGASLNIDLSFDFGLKVIVGGTLMEVFKVENGAKTQQLFTEKFTGVWTVSYEIKKWDVSIDYTGNLYSPMRLPLAGANDPRNEYSPWWSLQNIQITKKFRKGFELYGGVKNLLNWTPNKGNPFIIARTNDPFDKDVVFDANGQAQATANNPYALTFDPSYVYGPNQGMRAFLGFRYTFK